MKPAISTNAAASPGMQARPAEGYRGDVSPQLAYEWWQSGDAVLLDIRTNAELESVGFVPGALHVVWTRDPGTQQTEAFDQEVKAAVPEGRKALFLCRSGARSIAAAKRATELGIESYNVLEGFEGHPDESGQRSRRNGWKFHGLPWRHV
jgi:sulfur dioxygenase